MADLRIHPAIGVARVGGSDEFFIGPEFPDVPGNLDSASGRLLPFKDKAGQVLRQAARFRVFEFNSSGDPIREVTAGSGVTIEWRVHVANRKASFFSFNGQSGAQTTPPYLARAAKPATEIEKPNRGRGQPERKNRRNPEVADRRSLEIDPGEVRIASPGSSVVLTDAATSAPIKALGEIRMDPEGRLVFLGGRGSTASTANAPPVEEYASNDGWFDDMCDGSIHASITFPDGHREEAASAWVITGPPKFVPEVRNVVSLYDLLWDLAVRAPLKCVPGSDPILNDLLAQQKAWRPGSNDFDPSYQPSFTSHIYPILARALAVMDVHDDAHVAYHGLLANWAGLSDPDDDQLRQVVFKRLRDPNSGQLDRLGMPRGLGDDYTSLDDSENGAPNPPLATAFLSLTRVQYGLLKIWANGPRGAFKSDWVAGDVTYAPISTPGPVTPHGLDRAALENCVGSPFYPGIEVSWLIKQLPLYAGAFRLRDPEQPFVLGPLPFQAGFFSQQMALPWQADFYDCHKEDHTGPGASEPVVYMWWTAQRPDDTRPDAASPLRRWVAAFDAAQDPTAAGPDDTANLARFEQMRTRWSELSFIVLDGDRFVEQK
jgi:hypothetical protein